MGILVGKDSRVVVQGITGRQGQFHTKLMREYGTNIVAGVTPGKGGSEAVGVPVYDTVEESKRRHDANVSIIFVPAPYASDAVLEALDAGLKTVVVITEHVPIRDSVEFIARAQHLGAKIIGPNTPGIITPGETKIGIMSGHVFSRGGVGIVSRSGTLTYEIAWHITAAGMGQSTCLGIGGDPVTGVGFIDALELFAKDPATKAVVLVGEIGGNAEETAAKYIAETKYCKPVVAYVAGRAAPPGKRMGHAGAIVMGNVGTAQSKIEALTSVGVPVAQTPSEVAHILKSKVNLT